MPTPHTKQLIRYKSTEELTESSGPSSNKPTSGQLKQAINSPNRFNLNHFMQELQNHDTQNNLNQAYISKERDELYSQSQLNPIYSQRNNPTRNSLDSSPYIIKPSISSDI